MKHDYRAIALDINERVSGAMASGNRDEVERVLDAIEQEREARWENDDAAYERKMAVLAVVMPIGLTLGSAAVAIPATLWLAPLIVSGLVLAGVQSSSVLSLVVGAVVLNVVFWLAMFSPFALDWLRDEISWRKDTKYMASGEYHAHIAEMARLTSEMLRRDGKTNHG